jgi:carbamoylphosphate synthase large subunit
MAKILFTGARSFIALHLARLFKSAGHQVCIADSQKLTITRFSNAVDSWHFYPSPRLSPEKFIDALIDIIEKNHIEIMIPLFEELIYISQYKSQFPTNCRVLCADFDLILSLHNKYMLQELLKDKGFAFARSTLIQNEEALKNTTVPYKAILKLSYTRAAQNLHFLEAHAPLPTLPLHSHNPWVLQEKIEGTKYNTFSVCQEGKLLAHACYPIGFTIDGHSCLEFIAIQQKRVQEWVKNFAERTKFTGQIGFDFIECASTNKLYVIDANPRATAGVHLFSNRTEIVNAYLNQTKELIIPEKDARAQIATGMLMYGLANAYRRGRVNNFLKTFFNTPDVVFDKKDLKPFLMTPVLVSYYLKQSVFNGCKISEVFTEDLEWNGDLLPSE